ncbi:hypothetical protein Leryth_025144 [Lithospermum erythrorhizon]|nr:hypothetical protein Leryth_025144 [Lithospermum erythrorhizon]
MHDTNTETITDIPETMRLAEEMESKNTETQELISDNPDLLGVERISEVFTDDPINDKQLTPIFKSEELDLTHPIWQPSTRIINLDDYDGDDVKTEKKNKKRKHPMLYSQGTYPDRRRPIKKSKINMYISRYLSQLHEIFTRFATGILLNDEWVSLFVINGWINR